MTGRALLFDVGNTRVKWAIADGDALVRSGAMRLDHLMDRGFDALAARLPRNVGDVMISNVAGEQVADDLARFVRQHFDLDARFCRSVRTACGVTNGYRQPHRLGVDRWAAMIGARAESSAALCIVDAGSAITIDALDRDGRHLGGQIIPGLRLMGRSLKRDTSGMRDLRIRTGDPGSGMALFAGGTADAVRAGALNAVCGAIERAAKILRADGLRPRVFLTGGGAAPILRALDIKVSHRPDLVLKGLATMLRDAP
jgi:type III pantothenate kinase